MNAPDLSNRAVFSEDAFLGGRFVLRQPLRGLRAGSDALLLASAVPARPGDRLIEAGIGTGAAALALLARVGDTELVGIENDRDHAAIARENAALNGFAGRLTLIEADIADVTAVDLRARGHVPGFDHAFANPPYFDGSRSRAPANRSRRAARIAEPGTLGLWVTRLADAVAGGGTVTMIHRASELGELLAAFSRCLAGIVVLPITAHEGDDASRVIVQARKGARAAPRLLAPLVMHGPDGAYTSTAETVLRHGAALDLAGAPAAVVPSAGRD